MLLVCILSYLRHFINPCEGNFLCRKFRVFYVFCIHLIVTNRKTKHHLMLFSPRFGYCLKDLVRTPDTGGLGWIVGICGLVSTLMSRGSSNEAGPGLPWGNHQVSVTRFPAVPNHHRGSPDSCPDIPDLFQHVWDKSYFKKTEEQKRQHLSKTKQTLEVSFLYTYPLKHKSKYHLSPYLIMFSDLLITTILFGF